MISIKFSLNVWQHSPLMSSLELSFSKWVGSSHGAAVEMNPTTNREVAGLIPGLAQWVKDLVLP